MFDASGSNAVAFDGFGVSPKGPNNMTLSISFRWFGNQGRLPAFRLGRRDFLLKHMQSLVVVIPIL